MDLSNATWRKSSYSGGNGGNCVEIAALPDHSRAVRDSKDPEGPKLVLAPADMADFHRGHKGRSLRPRLSRPEQLPHRAWWARWALTANWPGSRLTVRLAQRAGSGPERARWERELSSAALS